MTGDSKTPTTPLNEAKPATKTDPIDTASPTGRERFQQSMSPRGGRVDDPEEDLWHGSYSAKDMIGAWLLLALLCVVVIGAALWVDIAMGPAFMTVVFWVILAVSLAALWFFTLARLWLVKWSVDYRLTTQRLIHKQGILRRTSDRVEVIDMDDIAFQQSLLQRMMGVGDITILSSDVSDPKLVLRGIDNVAEVAGKLDSARRKERVRRGIHVESV